MSMPVPTSSAIDQMKTLIQNNWQAIEKRAQCSAVKQYFAGKHRKVFELTDHPSWIVKVQYADESDEHKKMYEAMLSAQEVVKKFNLTRCVVPAVAKSVVEIEGNRKLIWIEQKLNGVYDQGEARDATEREFEKIPTDEKMRAKWKEIFTQTAIFMRETNYHDVDWRNLLFMGEQVGFVDFEKLKDPQGDAQRDRYSLGMGFLRLLEIAPSECIDPVLAEVEKAGFNDQLFNFAQHLKRFMDKGYVQSKTTFEEAVQMFREIRAEELQLNKELRAFHQTNGIVDPRQKLDASKYPGGSWDHPEGSWEFRLVNKLNEHLRSEYIYDKSTIGTRTFHWQPFSNGYWNDNPAFARDKPAFDRALAQLKQDRVIAAWKEEPNQYQAYNVSYKIYF